MSDPIINFNNRTLRVEHDGWYIEVRVLASGKQIAVTADPTPPTEFLYPAKPARRNRTPRPARR